MGISRQRNEHWHGPLHWALTNHLSAAGRCAGRGCALIRQLANSLNTRTALNLLAEVE